MLQHHHHPPVLALLLVLLLPALALSKVVFVPTPYGSQNGVGTNSGRQALSLDFLADQPSLKLTSAESLRPIAIPAAGTSNKCSQASLAGLFFWPEVDDDHDRAKMLTTLSSAGTKVVVLAFTDALLTVPEYIFEGVRTMSEAVAAGTRVVVFVASANDDTLATVERIVAGVNIKASGQAVVILPFGKAKAAWSKDWANDPNHDAVVLGLCLYSVLNGGKAADATKLDTTKLPAKVTLDHATKIAAACGDEVKAQQAKAPPATALATGGAATWLVPGVTPWAFSVETWGSSTERGIKGAMPAVLTTLNMVLNFRGNTGKSSSIVKPNYVGTPANPSDMMLKRSFAFGPGPDDYFPANAEEVKNYNVWMKYDYQVKIVQCGCGCCGNLSRVPLVAPPPHHPTPTPLALLPGKGNTKEGRKDVL